MRRHVTDVSTVQSMYSNSKGTVINERRYTSRFSATWPHTLRAARIDRDTATGT